MSKKPSVCTSGARVVFRRENDRWYYQIEGIEQLASALGEQLLASFLKCLHGADRLMGFEQLLFLSQSTLDENTAAYARNLRLLALSLASTLSELGEALQDLCNARVVDKLKNRDIWTPLNQLRGTLNGDARLRRVRNKVGFHLGTVDSYINGLRHLATERETADFMLGHGERRHDGECVMASDALIRGTGIPPDDFRWVIRFSKEAHENLPDLLAELWFELLTTAGVQIVDLSKESP